MPLRSEHQLWSPRRNDSKLYLLAAKLRDFCNLLWQMCWLRPCKVKCHLVCFGHQESLSQCGSISFPYPFQLHKWLYLLITPFQFVCLDSSNMGFIWIKLISSSERSVQCEKELTCFVLQVYFLPDISKLENFKKQIELVLCIETVPLLWNIVLP